MVLLDCEQRTLKSLKQFCSVKKEAFSSLVRDHSASTTSREVSRFIYKISQVSLRILI